MSFFLSPTFWLILFCFGPKPLYAEGVDFRNLDPYSNRNAYIQKDEATNIIGSILNLIYDKNWDINLNLSIPKSSIVRLYDGNLGSLNNIEKTFLEFNQPQANLELALPSWRKTDNISFTAIEVDKQPSSVSLLFVDEKKIRKILPLKREVIGTRGSLAHVEYRTSSNLGLPGGTLQLNYQIEGASNIRLGEFLLDDIGRPETKPDQELNIGPGLSWKIKFGPSVCPQIRKNYEQIQNKSTKQKLKLLLGNLNENFSTKMVYWKKIPFQKQGYSTVPLILQVDNTGNVFIDFIRAWLTVPQKKIKQSTPLVILPHQGHLYGGQEPLGVHGEKELSLASELARQGIASLVFESFPFGVKVFKKYDFFFKYHPNSGTTAKDLENLRRLLNHVLSDSFQNLVGLSLNKKRIGIWGYSYGSWISILAGAMDDRIRAIAFSAFHYHDKDIAEGLSSSLYIPQLACLLDGLNDPPPLSVKKLISEYDRNVFAVAPDIGLFKEWTEDLNDKRVSVVINPFGHLVTESERAAVLNFFYKTFSINNIALPRGVNHTLPRNASQMAPYIERENAWRTNLIKALSEN